MGKSKFELKLMIQEGSKGLWRFSSYLTSVVEEFKLSLGEGDTPINKYDENLFFKREDKNPTGSWKDRGMAYLISRAYMDGQKNLVLPSSGNAAISAAEYCQIAGLNLFVFVSEKIEKEKLALLEKKGVKIVSTLRPISEALRFAKERGYFLLRPSKSEFGTEGYQTIAFEIATQIGAVEDIFLPVSSGVGLCGIADGFKKLGFAPRLHVVQPAAVCPIAKKFDKNYSAEEENLARAIVAKFTPLSKQINQEIVISKGTGWVVSNQEIINAQKFLEENSLVTSNEGAMTYAAYLKAQNQGWSLGKTVCILTGKKYGDR